MALPAIDGFGVNQNPLAGNWATCAANGMQALGGIALGSTLNANNGSLWSADAFNANQYAQIQIANLGFPPVGGPIVRAIVGGDYYGLYLDLTNYRLFKAGSQAGDVIGYTAHGGILALDIWYLEVNGNVLTIKRNGGVINSAVDNAYAAGAGGFWAYSNTGAFDNFQAGNLGGSSAIKTVCGVARASVKTIDSVALASVKTVVGVA